MGGHPPGAKGALTCRDPDMDWLELWSVAPQKCGGLHKIGWSGKRKMILE